MRYVANIVSKKICFLFYCRGEEVTECFITEFHRGAEFAESLYPASQFQESRRFDGSVKNQVSQYQESSIKYPSIKDQGSSTPASTPRPLPYKQAGDRNIENWCPFL